MEKFEKAGDFGNLVRTMLLPSFEKARSQLRDIAQKDPMVLGLLEIADAIIFDEQERCFYQVYTNVPNRPGGSPSTVRFPMLPQEVGLLTNQIRQVLTKSEE